MPTVRRSAKVSQQSMPEKLQENPAEAQHFIDRWNYYQPHLQEWPGSIDPPRPVSARQPASHRHDLELAARGIQSGVGTSTPRIRSGQTMKGLFSEAMLLVASAMRPEQVPVVGSEYQERVPLKACFLEDQ